MRLRWSILLALWLGCAAPAFGADQIHFWDMQQRGGNSFNGRPPSLAYFRALRGYGASWVRLAHDKWPAARRDFLIGDADHFEGIPAADLRTLRATLDRAHAAGLRVVVTPLSLPARAGYRITATAATGGCGATRPFAPRRPPSGASSPPRSGTTPRSPPTIS